MLKLEVLKTQIEWCYHEKLLDENLDIMIFIAVGLGLGACSNAALKDQTSVNSGSLSQTNEATNTVEVNTNDSQISSFSDITYFDLTVQS